MLKKRPLNEAELLTSGLSAISFPIKRTSRVAGSAFPSLVLRMRRRACAEAVTELRTSFRRGSIASERLLGDGLRVSMALPNAPHATPLDVSVTSFEMTGLSSKDATPPRALTALADSIRLGCRGRKKGDALKSPR
jgi:hypothetical protein